MKIIYITNSRIPTEKAHGLQIMKMCEALGKAGVKVTLVLPKRTNTIKIDPFEYWGIERVFNIEKIFSLNLIDYRFLPKSLTFIFDSLAFSLASILYIKKGKNDYIYTRDRDIAFLSLFTQTPIVFEVHFIPRFLYVYKIFFKRLYKIAPITYFSKKVLESADLEKDNIIVLPDAVDIEKFRVNSTKEELREYLDLPKNKKIIMYVGQLFAWKGVQTLIEATNFISRDDFLLVIVGGSEKDIKNAKNILQENTLFVGQKRAEEIPKWLKSADVLVIPNSGKYDISRYYTSPMKLFEYMASRVSIISSDLPSLREIITENEAIFFKPDDAKDLAKTIDYVLENKDKVHLLSENAYGKVQEYTWEKRAKKILKELE